MEYVKRNGKSYLIGYHTQEWNGKNLEEPIICQHNNAWLGKGYYFWTDLEFAHYWGKDFKKGEDKKGHYDIYIAELDISNCLNTTFSEEGYLCFKDCLTDAINFLKQEKQKITLKRVNDYMLQTFWKPMGITGIIYDDLPSNPNPEKYKERLYSEIEKEDTNRPDFFYYKKRIQIVLFHLKSIHNFSSFLDENE